jgi:hypothetical protein
VALVWLLLAVVAVEIVVTYSRLPARELYHVSGTGIEGGASRLLVFTNFPTALVALAVLGLIAPRLHGSRERGAAALSALLCLQVFWPGVVSQANLDATPVNTAAAAGVLIALALCVHLARTGGIERRPWRPVDRGRVMIAAILVVASLPWFAAELGFFLNGVPALDQVFQSGAYLHRVVGLPPFPPAVHHGHHHGMDGLLLVLSALLLSRNLTRIRLLAAYLALMFCYGVGNLANDFWTEQVFKRGWTTWRIPDMLEPRPTVAWSVIVIATTVIWLLAHHRSPEGREQGASALLRSQLALAEVEWPRSPADPRAPSTEAKAPTHSPAKSRQRR